MCLTILGPSFILWRDIFLFVAPLLHAASYKNIVVSFDTKLVIFVEMGIGHKLLNIFFTLRAQKY